MQDSGMGEMLSDSEDTATIELVLPSNMLFDSGSAKVKQSGIASVVEIANSLSRRKDLIEIEIQGHTDSATPSQNAYYKDNWALSAARAGSIARVLLKSGIEKKYLKTTGMADLRPLFPEKNNDGRPNYKNMQKNRRVHLLIRKRASANAH
jgi:chemotaxis protein MotB